MMQYVAGGDALSTNASLDRESECGQTSLAEGMPALSQVSLHLMGHREGPGEGAA